MQYLTRIFRYNYALQTNCIQMKFSLNNFLLLVLVFILSQNIYARKYPKIKIKINKELPIQIGDTITITWSTTNVKHLYCYEISNEELPLNGSIEICPKSNIDYLFIAKRKRKERRKELKIRVVYPTVNSVNIPSSITDEETLAINWDFSNAKYVQIAGFEDNFSTKGKIPLKTDKDTCIQITAFNKYGYKTNIKTKVDVQYIDHFNHPKQVARNGNAIISWEYKNSDSIKFTNQSATLPPKGDIYIPMNENQNFRLEIYRKDGTFEVKSFKIDVYDSNIKYFTGNKTFFKGDNITLKWFVENADSVKLSCNEDTLPLIGQIKYSPLKDETFYLTAYLNGIKDTREFKTHMITRKFITGETEFSKLNKNTRLDYEIFSTDLSEFPDIVKLYVLVVDTSGNFVHGLAPPTISDSESKKYFIGLVETYIGNKNKNITDFKVEEHVSIKKGSRNISLVLDYSGSMITPINTLEFATKSFINNKNEDDKLNIYKFDNHIKKIIGLTKDKNALNHKYKKQGLKDFGGSTALYAAIGEGIYSVKESDQLSEVVIFTDGYENSSLFVKGAKAFNAIQVAEMARVNDIKLTCISFGNNVNKPLLETLANYTGGKYFDIETDKEIIGVWTELPYLSANYYIITFKTNSVENLNGVKLMYNNNIGQNITTKKEIYTEIPKELNETSSASFGYWNYYDSLYNNKTPLSLPQAIGYFSFNGTILLEKYEKNVELLVDQMNQDSTLDVVIFGHTDKVDSEDYNIKLSTQRCNWAKNFFIEKGIDKHRIITIPLGEKYPVHAKEDFSWQAQENRRIEVLLIK